MTRAAIALGSNLGDRQATLRAAVARLEEFGALTAVSSLYETAPIGGPEQGPYLNAVVVLDTDLDASALLGRLHQVERDSGRERIERWGPRTLDLDLILHGHTDIDEDGITVPHPRYRERRFVLEPLLEAWPGATHADGAPLAPLLAEVAGQDLARIHDPAWYSPAAPHRTRGSAWVFGQAVALLVTAVALVGFAGQFDWGRPLGWFFLAAGLAQGLASFRRLGRMTTPYPEPISDGTLIERGIYGLVRHPMYGSLILLTLGAGLALGSLGGLLAWPALVAFFSVKARHEETRLAASYSGYAAYRQRVRRRFVPWIG